MEQESKEDSVGRDENKSAGISCQVLPGEDTQVSTCTVHVHVPVHVHVHVYPLPFAIHTVHACTRTCTVLAIFICFVL